MHLFNNSDHCTPKGIDDKPVNDLIVRLRNLCEHRNN